MQNILRFRTRQTGNRFKERTAVEQVFESERIRYVRVSEELINDYLVMLNDVENVTRLIGLTGTVTEESEIAWVKKKLENNEDVFSMIEKKAGEFIGNVELKKEDGSSVELGIAITADKQDRGFGREAIRAVTAYAFGTLGVGRVSLKVYPYNARAIHVYGECGFREYDRTDDDVFMEIFRQNTSPAEDDMNLKLIKLTKEYEIPFGEMIEEWKADQKLHHTNRSPWSIFKNEHYDFDYYLEHLEHKVETKDRVPDSVFFMLDRSRDRLIGAVNIRHYLNEKLLLDGGHIGLGVRPSERRKGYATRMLRLALDECRKLGLDRVLITCDKDNIGSARTIMNNGGVLENEIIDSDGETVQRYWIEL